MKKCVDKYRLFDYTKVTKTQKKKKKVQRTST